MKPGSCGISSVDTTNNENCSHSFVAGDAESMSLAIEEEYGTNPYDEKTTPIADNDGKLIAGLGMKELEWEFQAGDEVAVIVEGMGMVATKHKDATYQTVFAMSKDGCGKLESSGEYGETINKKVISIDTTTKNPTTCLNEDMFEKPGLSYL